MHPFSHQRDATIASLGEVRLLERMRAWLGPCAPPSPEGMGDDCAILPIALGAGALLTTDAVSFGHHFDASTTPEAAGAKLIKRNLSDLAAMGGEPGSALLTLLCGPDLRLDWLERFVRGARERCSRHGIAVVGGDVSEVATGAFSAVLAQTGRAARAVLRSGAGAGDRLYVTGDLGGALAGKHLDFEPRLAEGAWLAARAECTAMIDLTDGLAKDLPAIVPDGLQARVDPDAVPIAAAAREAARASGRPALDHAFADGEDYELLFTARNDGSDALETAWAKAFPKTPLHAIGRMARRAKEGPAIADGEGAPLPYLRGFEHLRSGPDPA